MTLDHYSNLNRSDSFCYWLERKAKILGSVSGNSSFKFGIYQYNERPKDDRARMTDDKYAWYSSLGKTSKARGVRNVVKHEGSGRLYVSHTPTPVLVTSYLKMNKRS